MKNMKFVRFIGYGLLAISVIITIAFLATSDFTTNEYPLTDTILQWTYAMIILAAVLSLVMPLINIVKNPKAMVRSLMGVGIIVVLILVCYLMADTTPVTTPSSTYDGRADLLVTDTGLYATYITFVAAIVAVIGGELLQVFKK